MSGHRGAAHQRVPHHRAPSPGIEDLSRLLSHLANGETSSRVELARRTGLARSTVSERVDELLAAGIVIEESVGQSTGGRPPRLLRLNRAAGVILAVDLDITRTRLAVTDLACHPLQRATVEVAIGEGPDKVLGLAQEHLGQLLARAGRSITEVRGIGVSVIGPVEHTTGKVVRPPIMPGWDGCDIPGHFRDFCTVPTIVDNDVNLMALAEHRIHQPGVDHLLFVRVDTGIGCGIISQGSLHRGAQGAAGDIGHIRLPENDAPCSCGDTGCLEAIASGAAIASALTAAGHNATSAHHVTELVKSGNQAARSAVRIAARHIGDILAGLVSFHNPAVVAIGGELARLEEELLTGIRARVYDHALPLATRSLRIEISQLGDDAATIGATLLTQQEILAPERLPSLLGRHDDSRR